MISFLCISEPVTLSEDMELKQELVMMSPPASDSGSGSPPQLSPYCVDSEPGSPLLDHEQVKPWMQVHIRRVSWHWNIQTHYWSSRQLFLWITLCKSSFILPFHLPVKEWARFSFLSWSDGPLSTAPLCPDLFLPVTEPTAITAGLWDFRDRGLFAGPRTISNTRLVPKPHTELWWEGLGLSLIHFMAQI